MNIVINNPAAAWVVRKLIPGIHSAWIQEDHGTMEDTEDGTVIVSLITHPWRQRSEKKPGIAAMSAAVSIEVLGFRVIIAFGGYFNETPTADSPVA